jgi:anti-anti-sigma factor
MEIARQQRDDHLELSLEGRLDGYWAQHLTDTAAAVLREGTHAVRLNLARVSYISSAGVGALVHSHKQFVAVGGSLVVVEPSAMVAKVLHMVGLTAVLTTTEPGGTSATDSAPAVERREVGGASFEIRDAQRGERLACRVLGNPALLARAGYGAADSRLLVVGENAFSLGLGSFGDGFDSARESFGEFLAVAGAAASQPTDGTNFPDYMVASGTFVPQLTALYGFTCEGGFSKLVRFEGADPVTLSVILSVCLEAAGGRTAGVVMVAESAGLVGATLKRPPVSGEQVFGFPDVRQWLSFSAERCCTHSLVLAAGVVTTQAEAALGPFVRPLTRGSGMAGHFHAAAFAYRPLPKGGLEMRTAVRSLFDGGGLQSVLHLLADDREVSGSGESELLRGACWVSPVSEVLSGGAPE